MNLSTKPFCIGRPDFMNSSSTWFRSAQSAKAINEVTLPAVDVNTNKFSNTTDYEFDAVGNLIRDVHGRQFTFNGDNKQVEVRNSASQVVGEYKYDGLGKRIKKATSTSRSRGTTTRVMEDTHLSIR